MATWTFTGTWYELATEINGYDVIYHACGSCRATLVERATTLGGKVRKCRPTYAAKNHYAVTRFGNSIHHGRTYVCAFCEASETSLREADSHECGCGHTFDPSDVGIHGCANCNGGQVEIRRTRCARD